MPRLFDDINICGRANARCIAHVTREIQLKTNKSFICDCLPGCYAISYEAEISMAPLLKQPPSLRKKQMAPGNAALLHIFYKDFYFRSQKKEELIGFTEFLCKLHVGVLKIFIRIYIFVKISKFFAFPLPVHF